MKIKNKLSIFYFILEMSGRKVNVDKGQYKDSDLTKIRQERDNDVRFEHNRSQNTYGHLDETKEKLDLEFKHKSTSGRSMEISINLGNGSAVREKDRINMESGFAKLSNS